MNRKLCELSHRMTTEKSLYRIKGAEATVVSTPAVHINTSVFNQTQFRLDSKHKLELYFIITILQKDVAQLSRSCLLSAVQNDKQRKAYGPSSISQQQYKRQRK